MTSWRFVFLVNNFLAEEGISMELVAGLVICLIGLEGELFRAGVGKTGLKKKSKNVTFQLSQRSQNKKSKTKRGTNSSPKRSGPFCSKNNIYEKIRSKDIERKTSKPLPKY